MSSWKKAAKSNQQTHRERHQPVARKHLGLLEKKKDYKLRAQDKDEKQATLKLLNKRALSRNPDEFFHHMINSKIFDGEHHENEKDDEHTPEQIHLMQTQDVKYVTMKRTIEANKIERMQSELHMIDIANKVKNTHTFFTEDSDDEEEFDLAKRLDTHPDLVHRRTNRPRLADLDKLNVSDADLQSLQKMSKKRENAYNELKNRIEREKMLTVVQQKMNLKRTLQQKRLLKPKRIAPGTKDTAPVYQFKYERKK